MLPTVAQKKLDAQAGISAWSKDGQKGATSQTLTLGVDADVDGGDGGRRLVGDSRPRAGASWGVGRGDCGKAVLGQLDRQRCPVAGVVILLGLLGPHRDLCRCGVVLVDDGHIIPRPLRAANGLQSEIQFA